MSVPVRSDRFSAAIRVVAAVLAAALAVLTVKAYTDRRIEAVDRKLMQAGLEDAAKRVRSSAHNLAVIRELNDDAALAKARAFAGMVARDPGLLGDQARLDAIAVELNVDELHVSDGKGILVAGVPTSYVGHDMSKYAQSAPFMGAITNASFALAQEPLVKGIPIGGAIDRLLFQYAGVARIDTPGIIQVGRRADRVEEAMRMADVAEITRSMRIGSAGRVSAVPLRGLATRAQTGEWRAIVQGVEMMMREADCGDWRVTVSMPAAASALARDGNFRLLLAADLMALLLLAAAFRWIGGRRLAEGLRALGALFGGAGSESAKSGAWRDALRNPFVLTCAGAFLTATAVSWFVSEAISTRKAEDLLRANSADLCAEILESPNDMLFFIGNAICRHYKTPEAMTADSVSEVLSRYDIDELNVINAQGVVIASSLAAQGFVMASNPNSAKFNCLLEGARTYCQPFRSAIEDPNVVRKYAGIAFERAKGYIQIGFDRGRLRNDVQYRFENSVAGRRVGKRGFFMCAEDATGEIVSCGHSAHREGDTLASVGVDVAKIPSEEGRPFEATIYGERCLCVAADCAYHRLLVAMPCREIAGGLVQSVLITSAVLLAVFALVAFFMTRLTQLVNSLKSYIAAERARQEQDLAVARTVQTSSLPVVFPDTPEYKVFAKMVTAREVGGDFFDFYPVDSHRVLVLVADVSGKGVPAAMFMMKAKAVLKACVFERADLASAVAEANSRLADENQAEMFVTAWVGVLDTRTGGVEYVNAGHNAPLVKRADGSVEWVTCKPSLVLAAMGGVRYASHSLELRPGDSLFLYTDGVTEAVNRAGEFYGDSRLERAMARAGREFVTEVEADVAAFVDGAEPFDDITLLALDFKKCGIIKGRDAD